MDFRREPTLSGSTAPHTRSHQDLIETGGNSDNANAQLDTLGLNPGTQPPCPASRSNSCQLDVIAGETGSTGHCGSAPPAQAGVARLGAG